MKPLARMVPGGVGCAALVLAVIFVPTRVSASTIPFTDALAASLNPDSYAAAAPAFTTSPYVLNSSQQVGTPPPVSSVNQQVSGAWGNTSITGSADLSTGILRADASAMYNGSSAPEVYAQTNASFGDGFRTTTTGGQPFTWGPNGTAQFDFTVDGSLTSNPPLSATGGGAFLLLELYQPGTLNPSNAYGIQPNDVTY